jgi:hypothetical protein
MVTTSDTRLGRALADGLLRHHTSWRRESDAVKLAYEGWTSSDTANRELAYARYLAALDQEELAAHRYRDHVAWVERIAR